MILGEKSYNNMNAVIKLQYNITLLKCLVTRSTTRAPKTITKLKNVSRETFCEKYKNY